MKCYSFSWFHQIMRIKLDLGGRNLWLGEKKLPVKDPHEIIVRHYPYEYYIRDAEPLIDSPECILVPPSSSKDQALVLWRVAFSQGDEHKVDTDDALVVCQECHKNGDVRWYTLLVMSPGQTLKYMENRKGPCMDGLPGIP